MGLERPVGAVDPLARGPYISCPGRARSLRCGPWSTVGGPPSVRQHGVRRPVRPRRGARHVRRQIRREPRTRHPLPCLCLRPSLPGPVRVFPPAPAAAPAAAPPPLVRSAGAGGQGGRPTLGAGLAPRRAREWGRPGRALGFQTAGRFQNEFSPRAGRDMTSGPRGLGVTEPLTTATRAGPTPEPGPLALGRPFYKTKRVQKDVPGDLGHKGRACAPTMRIGPVRVSAGGPAVCCARTARADRRLFRLGHAERGGDGPQLRPAGPGAADHRPGQKRIRLQIAAPPPNCRPWTYSVRRRNPNGITFFAGLGSPGNQLAPGPHQAPARSTPAPVDGQSTSAGRPATGKQGAGSRCKLADTVNRPRPPGLPVGPAGPWAGLELPGWRPASLRARISRRDNAPSVAGGSGIEQLLCKARATQSGPSWG